MNWIQTYSLIIIILINICGKSCTSSVLDWFDWLSSSKNPDSSVINKEKQFDNVREGVTLFSIPFEELSNEEKFLQEAERFSSVSPSGLDTCEHRVVMKIQSSCSELSEEQLAKLSIGLLNCQSELSGRDPVDCRDEMTLKECTSPMDSETWNAYHTINNRARAVCYATRQQQFRALSEMAVNKLMSSALTQLSTMDNLKELQKELNLLTSDTVTSVREGHASLLDQNSGLRLAQMKVQDSIVGNLKQLSQEKTLIQDTQYQLKTLSEKLSKEFEGVESKLGSQNEQFLHLHQQIISTFTDITAKADKLWTAMDEKSKVLLRQQSQIQKSTSETLENLKRINASVVYLLNLVNNVKEEIDSKMVWTTKTFGEDQAILLSLLLHTVYLLAGVLASLFIQLSLVCRLFLVAAVLSNIALVYRHQALNFLPLTSVIVGGWAMISLVPWCWSFRKRYQVDSMQRRENTNNKQEDKEEDELSTKSSSKSGSIFLNNNLDHSSSVFRNDNDEMPLNNLNSLSSMRYRRSTSRTDSGSQSVCAAVCRNGQLCRSTPTPGLKFCRRHIPQ